MGREGRGGESVEEEPQRRHSGCQCLLGREQVGERDRRIDGQLRLENIASSDWAGQAMVPYGLCCDYCTEIGAYIL